MKTKRAQTQQKDNKEEDLAATSISDSLFEASNPTSAKKTLLVLEIIINAGPIIARDIIDASGLNRLVVYRALNELENMRWIRPRLGDRAWLISSKFEASYAETASSIPELDQIHAVICDVSKESRLHCDVAIVPSAGQIKLVESTEPGIVGSDEISFIWSDLTLSAISGYSQNRIWKHLEVALLNATNEEIAEVRSGAFMRRMQAAKMNNGYVFNDAAQTLTAPLKMNTTLGGALRLRDRQIRRKDQEYFQEAMERILNAQ